MNIPIILDKYIQAKDLKCFQNVTRNIQVHLSYNGYWEKPGLFGKDFFLSKKIKTNQFLGFKKKKNKLILQLLLLQWFKY